MADPKPPFVVRALYDYESDHPDDLPFKEGQRVHVDTVEDEDWFTGHYADDESGKSGMFPRNFVEIVPETKPKRQPPPIPQPKAEPTAEPESEAEPAREAEAVPEPEPERQVEPEPVPELKPVPVSKPSEPIEPVSVPKPKEPKEPDTEQRPEPAAPKEKVQPEVGSIETGTKKLSLDDRVDDRVDDEPPKRSSFKDRIAAFNAQSEAPPVPLFQQPKSQSFVNRQFFDSGQSHSHSYVPPVPKSPPQSSAPVHKQAPPPPPPAASHDEDTPKPRASDEHQQEDENVPKMSLKDRIKMLQQQQEEERARAEAAIQKKKHRAATAKKKEEAPVESGESAEAAAHEAGQEVVHGEEHAGEPTVEGTEHEPREAHHPIEPTSSAEGEHVPEGTEGTGAPVVQGGQDSDEDDDERPPAPPAGLPMGMPMGMPMGAPMGAPMPHDRHDQEREDDNDEDNDDDEDEESDEEDEEEAKRIALRERMAKISGGMGMHLGMILPGAGVPASSKPKKKKEKKDQEAPEEPEQPQAAPVAVMPFADSNAIKHLGQNKDQEHDEQHEDEEHEGQELTRNISNASKGDAEPDHAPPPPPSERGAPPPPPTAERPPTERAPSSPTAARGAPPPPPTAERPPAERSPSSPTAARGAPPLPPTAERGAPPPPPTAERSVPPPPATAERSVPPPPSTAERSVPPPPTADLGIPPPPPVERGAPPPPPVAPPPETSRANRLSTDSVSSREGERVIGGVNGSTPVPAMDEVIEDELGDDERTEESDDTNRYSLSSSHTASRDRYTSGSGIAPPVPMSPSGAPQLPPLDTLAHQSPPGTMKRASTFEPTSSSPQVTPTMRKQTSFEPMSPQVPPPPPPPTHRRSIEEEQDDEDESTTGYDADEDTDMNAAASYDEGPAPRSVPPPPPPHTGPPRPPPVMPAESLGEDESVTTEEDSPMPQIPLQAPRGPPPQAPQAPLTQAPQAPQAQAPQAPQPPAPGHQVRSSLDRSSSTMRSSVDMGRGRGSLDGGSIVAHDVDTNAGPDGPWWTAPQGVPPSIASRAGRELIYEVEDSETSKRGGRTIVVRDIYILYHDYSQTGLTVRFDKNDPINSVTFEQSHQGPPNLRQDQLEDVYERFGPAILDHAQRAMGQSFDGQFVPQIIRSVPGTLPSIGQKAHGALIYSNLANASVRQYDEIRPGDVIAIKNAKFQGHKGGLHQKYSQEVGKDAVRLGIAYEWDGTKKKVRVYEEPLGKKVRQESYRLGDLKSGEVRAYRVVGRDYVGWD